MFQAFKTKFEGLSEQEFASFWCVYFVTLILDRFINNPEYAALTAHAASQTEEFKRRCRLANIPDSAASRGLRDLVGGALAYVKSLLTKSEQRQPQHPSTTEDDSNGEPLFLNELHAAILAILKASDLKLWIMLDRLDEVFLRRSKVECTSHSAHFSGPPATFQLPTSV